ncbi:MAG: KH domain-containing protein [Planctomycetota bacterium]
MPDQQYESVEMKDFITVIVKEMVDDPEVVQVNEIGGEKTVVLELRVAKNDMGKVIGRHGQNAKALRTLLSAASAKLGKRAILEILED